MLTGMRSALLVSLEQPFEEVQVLPVDGPQLVAHVEGELRCSTYARQLDSHEVADSKTGRREYVETAAEGGLMNRSIQVKQQRVKIDPAAAWAISSTRFGRQSVSTA